MSDYDEKDMDITERKLRVRYFFSLTEGAAIRVALDWDHKSRKQ